MDLKFILELINATINIFFLIIFAILRVKINKWLASADGNYIRLKILRIIELEIGNH